MTENAELSSLRRENSVLKDRLSRLQAHVDREGERLVNGVIDGIVDASSAASAADNYDADWFASLPYSPKLVSRIAHSLLGALSQYPFIDASDVRDVARNGDHA